ncbi:hypothetical protein L3X39_06365 [Sabulilitoribacter multivorans]|uniref:DUF6896 domain-containing protein n=1 Tax=Flaviramulus multivorans TaxID=1304750 RepID=A0ABS9IIP7_9FLAO|nr:hypothetical protein [Flaviramulus multivorans]MCF7560258.1 hypothetical protein [Flaviramulus multivorans]
MEDKLNIYDLIKDYQLSANKVVKIFKKKYGIENLLEGWHSRKYEQTGELKANGLKFYAFHGIGLSAHFNDKIVDFDFAFFPEQRWDGFDLWRLKGFVSSQPAKYKVFMNENYLESEFEKLKKNGEIKNPKLEFSTTLYFWSKDIPNEPIELIDFEKEKVQKKW